MIRLGFHYVEPRRVGFFLAEEAALAGGFAAAAAMVGWTRGAPAPAFALAAFAVAAGAVIAFALSLADLHDLRVALDAQTSTRRLLRVLGAMAVVAAVAALVAGGVAGRLHGSAPGFAAAGAAGLVGASLALVGTRATLLGIGPRGALHTRVFLVGEGQTAHRLLREAARDGDVEVVGFCGPGTENVAERARAEGADIVVVAADDRRGLRMDELLRCRVEGLAVTDAALFATRVLHRLPVDLVHPADLVYGDGFVRPVWVRVARRALSVAAAIVLLVLSSPLLLAALIAVKLDSPGPMLFRQSRVGKDGREFSMVKLRTMTVGAEQGGATWAREGDPRVTRVGRYLRRFRVDELPQLWNVLRGDMDLVGPRPERPEFVSTLRKHIPFYDLRHVLAPGISGWAQVCFPYAASVEEAREKLQYDLYYVRHASVGFDLYILLLTARTILLGRGAR